MDGGPEQKRMSASITASIRKNALTKTSKPATVQDVRSTSDQASQTSSGETTQSSTLMFTKHSIQPIDPQLSAIMLYLDHVHPYLFPNYHPPLLETGRQWLLGLLLQNEVFFHLAASLSAHFFSLAQDMQYACMDLVYTQLLKQTDLAVASVRQSIARVEIAAGALDIARVMQEVTQLLLTEVMIRPGADWQIHLAPARILLGRLIEEHAGPVPSLAGLLKAVSQGPSVVHDKPLPYTADQSALLFFTSLLLHIDTIAGTVLLKAPSLRRYHAAMLSEVDLYKITGCETWILEHIAKITTLAEQAGLAEQAELLLTVKDTIDEKIEALPQRNTKQSRPGIPDKDHQLLRYHVNTVWAHTTRIYLLVTWLGWQPELTDVQHSVSAVLNSLNLINDPAYVRSLSWPLCVAGCLALQHQEADFRAVPHQSGRLIEVSNLREVVQIMEAVWSSRKDLDSSWRMADILGILGQPPLLI